MNLESNMVRVELALPVRCLMICLLAWVFPDPLSPLQENKGITRSLAKKMEKKKEPEVILRPRDGRRVAYTFRESMG